MFPRFGLFAMLHVTGGCESQDRRCFVQHAAHRTTKRLAAAGCLAALIASAAANLPAAEPASADSGGYWAYRTVQRPASPAVNNAAGVQTPVDAFVLARLEAAGLTLAPAAEKRVLLRRATFDLLGLPPTPGETDQFLADDTPGAYERLVERLLASPHYGERWGRIWLDAVRFADSAGYNADPVRPLAYKYRDYVIAAFNRDVPYDRFVQEQLAGDELFPESADAVVATGFNRLPPDESNASDVLLARQDMLNDLTATVGAVFLAQSMGCAQCHDHKFDAISQRDFYRLQAFFAGVIPVDAAPVAPADRQVEFERRLGEWLTGTAALRSEIANIEWAARGAAWKEKRARFPEVVWQAMATPVEDRTAVQHQLCFYTERQIDVKESQMLAIMPPEQRERRAQLRADLARLLDSRPQPPEMVQAMACQDGRNTPITHLLAGGSYTKPLSEVAPGFPAALAGADRAETDAAVVAPRPGTVGRRAALARWLVAPDNPLTARVLVNRVWQGHFGQGLVENANDFGVQTRPPTHPDLLDWLAAEFVEPTVPTGNSAAPWSIKRLHRLMMLSATYRQAAEATAARSQQAAIADPDNHWYWRFPRRRLEAESVRDALLAVSGLLNPQMFGPGVRPELPPNFSSREAWPVSKDLADRQRRSIYILVKRNLPYPLLEAFDFPDAHESCARRQVTTTAPQALMLMNSEMVLHYAQAFAGRLLADNPHAGAEALTLAAYRLAFCREPTADEIDAATAFLDRQRGRAADRMAAGEPVLLPRGLPKFLDPAMAASVVDFCHVLLNANEFVYLD